MNVEFSNADKNRDGFLNPTEFKNYVKRMAKLGSRDAKKVVSFGAYGIGFRRADGNKDGKITKKELRRFK